MIGIARGTSPNRLPGLLKDRHLANKVFVDIAANPHNTRVCATHLVPPRTIYSSHASSQGVVRCTNSTEAHSLIHADRIQLDEIRRHIGIFVDTKLIAVVAEYTCICALGGLGNFGAFGGLGDCFGSKYPFRIFFSVYSEVTVPNVGVRSSIDDYSIIIKKISLSPDFCTETYL